MSKVIHVLKQREKRVFYSFLAVNNALKQFKQNCRYRGRDLDWVSNQYDFQIEDIINLSFYWGLQPEGVEFWQSLHRKWFIYIENQHPFG